MKWKTAKVSSLCDLKNGKAYNADDWATEGLPIIRIQNLNDSSKGFNYWSGTLDKQIHVRPKDLLLAWSGTPGTSFGAHIWNGPEGVLNQHIFRIDILYGNIEKRWFQFCLNQQLNSLIHQAHGGVGLKHVTKGAVDALEIPLPPLAEQKRIAAILDAADALRAKRREALAQLDALLQSTFLTLFGDPVENPMGWPVVTIGDLLSSTAYGTSTKAHEEKRGFPCLRMNNITYAGGWDFRSLKYVDLKPKEVSKNTVHRGQILFNRTNSKELVGKTAVYRRDEPMAFAGYLVRGITNAEADAEYISAFLNLPQGKAILQGMCKSIVGMANINAQEFKSISLPKPPIALQQRFAAVVKSVEHQKAAQRGHLTELDALFAALQHRAFRGEL